MFWQVSLHTHSNQQGLRKKYRGKLD